MTPSSQTPNLLLVHGAWHGAWCWEDEFAPYLRSKGLNVITMDLPGHSGSGPKRLPWYSIGDYVNAVEKKLLEIGQPTAVLGHSMGGYVVQKLMERQPKHLAAAILFAPATQRGVLGVVGNLIRQHPIDFLVANLTLSLYHLVRTPAHARALFHSATLPEAALQKHWQRISNESFRAFLDMLVLAPIQAKKASSTLPKLVIGGEKDTVFPPNIVNRCAHHYGVSATIYQGHPHCLQQDPNWQPVADDISSWVKSAIA